MTGAVAKPVYTSMGRVCIIGDVHGMTTMLAELLDTLELKEGDTLISLGDLVDKGPDPVGSVQLLRNLRETAPFPVILIEANHEDRHLRYHRNLTERPGVAQQMAKTAPMLAYLDDALGEKDRAFLASAVPFWQLPDIGILCVHGGIPGNLKEFPESVEAAKSLSGKDGRQLRQILRTRYICQKSGAFLSYGKEKPGDPFWAEVYDGRFGHVVFGHQPFFEGPAEFPHATGIDTGAVDGGALTALVVHEGGRRNYVSVRRK
ncbi:MAG: metallophosphoesterase family protein [Pseudomonadota bacterium]